MMNSEEYTYLFLRVGMKEFVNEEMHEEIKICISYLLQEIRRLFK